MKPSGTRRRYVAITLAAFISTYHPSWGQSGISPASVSLPLAGFVGVTDGSITSQMFRETVSPGTHGLPSAGKALGEAITYYRNDVYRNQWAAIQNCIFNNSPPGCDEARLYMQQQQGYAHFAANVAVVAVDASIALQGVSISLVGVDSSIWAGTTVGRAITYTKFAQTTQHNIRNGIDLVNTLVSQSGSATATTDGDVRVDAINGKFIWDNDGNTSWILSDLKVEATIRKEVFQNIIEGSFIRTLSSFYPNASSFGVLSVDSIIDPPAYDTVFFTYQQIDYIASSIPEPWSVSLFVGFVLFLATFDRYRRFISRTFKTT